MGIAQIVLGHGRGTHRRPGRPGHIMTALARNLVVYLTRTVMALKTLPRPGKAVCFTRSGLLGSLIWDIPMGLVN